MRSRLAISMIGISALAIQLGSGSSSTSARFSSSATSAASEFTGATLSATVAPVIIPSLEGRSVRLRWGAVSSARPVAYEVRRIDGLGNAAPVCVAPSAPTVNAGSASCLDGTALADSTYTFTQRPYIDIPGSTPWSLAPSVAGTSFLVPRLGFLDSGAAVGSTGARIDVPYPTVARTGDVLLLVSVSGRNRPPTTPAGWTTLVSRGIGGSSTVHLYVAWKVNDGGASVTFDPQTNGLGAIARVIVYGRTNGNTATPVVSASGVIGTSAASTTLTPPTGPTVTGPNSTVISLVATGGATSPSLSAPKQFGLRLSTNSTPGSGSVSLGIADANVAATGGTTAPPTWSQTSALQWAYATVAFR